MGVNKAILSAWKFANFFESDHKVMMKGLTIECSQYPHASPKKKGKECEMMDKHQTQIQH